MWRKNRRDNQDGEFGVDLNRNYSYKWGTGGSDTDTSSEVYMGPAPFSEPETRAIRDFITVHANTKVLLTFHTFSELVLYPWGYTYDKVGNIKDAAAFVKMAKTMAAWNHYTAEQTSSLYIASGDTTDWAYGEKGIFAFTFELSPDSMDGGGFYPGAQMIDKVFKDNLQPCLYLIDVAGDPYKVLDNQPTGWLKHYVEPHTPEAFMWQPGAATVLR
jgi:carboxypeptidase T